MHADTADPGSSCKVHKVIVRLCTAIAHHMPLYANTIPMLLCNRCSVSINAGQTEKYFDMLGTGAFAVLSLGSLLAARSRHARKVRSHSSNSIFTDSGLL
jgi:hypothetical protein